MSIRFDNGTEIETGGPLRILHLEEGLYVTGEGHLIPCGSEEEADETLRGIIRDIEKGAAAIDGRPKRGMEASDRQGMWEEDER